MIPHHHAQAPQNAVATPLSVAIAAALARIPPLWPLDHFVAVNPFMGFVDRPFPEACALLQRVTGAAPLLPPREYRQAYEEGRITDEHLMAASAGEWGPGELLRTLEEPEDKTLPVATVVDVLEHCRPNARWRAFVANEISKWCGVYFDENQTTWSAPWRQHGLYAAWREAATVDRNPECFGIPRFRTFVEGLPMEPEAAIRRCLEVLSPPADELTNFLHRQLFTVSGWAAYVQYRVREDALRGRANDQLRSLLAIRLAYDAALHQAFSGDTHYSSAWQARHATAPDLQRHRRLACWQTAYEVGYQNALARSLARQTVPPHPSRPVVQVIFCIDVRSEVLRRHLEAAMPRLRTIGFAGFFGFPVSHRSSDSGQITARCPALIVPAITCTETLSQAQIDAAAMRRTRAGAWKAFQNSAASCFAFVESAGLFFAGAFGRSVSGRQPSDPAAGPEFADASIETRTSLAAAALRNMGLLHNFGRLVLICGHGSRSANNPHASGLDCGACGGHAGDINARLAAATLNDRSVRTRLAETGIVIPDDTYFLAGLHNTATDDVLLFDIKGVPGTHLLDFVNLRLALARAGDNARRERAESLGLADLNEDRLQSAMHARANDPAEVRPEWGLANNAALVAAPRWRTAQLKLDGRVFLHDYDPKLDPNGDVLSLILSAPVVVASWINLQYFASRTDPLNHGAGNKVLHNIVGGVAAMEGNGGDIRTGLPYQSIHNGRHFVHEPRRLAVYLEANPAAIEAALARNPEVRRLFEHGWMTMYSLSGERCFRYFDSRWLPVN